MALTFKPFDYNTELSAQREVFALCFPETVGKSIESVEHYKWKFHTFPQSPSSYEYIATEGDKILGYYAAIP